MLNIGDAGIVRKVRGKCETRRFLESLGFIEGGSVKIVSKIGDNMIVNVKNSRIALSKCMANLISI